jgi:Cu2+-containing amine oxidase
VGFRTENLTRWKGAAFLLAAAVLLLAYGGISSPSGERTPLPFDPLSEAEEQQAINTALASPLVSTLLTRYETIGAALNTDKHRMRVADPPRVADVWFYDYNVDRTLYAVVDLGTSIVESHALLAYQPPVTAREMAHAADLAFADHRVQHALEPRMPYATLDTIVRGWECGMNRCVLVGFEIDGEYVDDLFVLVNLSRDHIEELLEGQRLHTHKEEGH